VVERHSSGAAQLHSNRRVFSTSLGDPSVAASFTRQLSRNQEFAMVTLWCTDFSRLQELLSQDGTDLVVEKALGVGAVPLSEVSLGEKDEATIEVVARERNRTI
jgi:hypothetical protein